MLERGDSVGPVKLNAVNRADGRAGTVAVPSFRSVLVASPVAGCSEQCTRRDERLQKPEYWPGEFSRSLSSRVCPPASVPLQMLDLFFQGSYPNHQRENLRVLIGG